MDPTFSTFPTTAQNGKGLVRSQLERHDETHGSDGPHGSMPVGSGKGLSIATTENIKASGSSQLERPDEAYSSDDPHKSVPWWSEKSPALGPTALGMEVGAHCTGGDVGRKGVPHLPWPGLRKAKGPENRQIGLTKA